MEYKLTGVLRIVDPEDILEDRRKVVLVERGTGKVLHSFMPFENVTISLVKDEVNDA